MAKQSQRFGFKHHTPKGSRLGLYLDPTLRRAFKAKCLENEMKISDRLRLLIDQDVNGTAK